MRNVVRFFSAIKYQDFAWVWFFLVPAGRSFSGSMIHGFATIDKSNQE